MYRLIAAGLVLAAALCARGQDVQIKATETACSAESSLAVNCSVRIELAETRPAPPVIVVPQPQTGEIIFRETFTGAPAGGGGAEYVVKGSWNTSQDPNGSVTIKTDNPVRPGFGAYMRPRLVRSGANDFRAEYANLRAPGGQEGGKLAVSGDNAWSDADHWYGYILCIDRFDQPASVNAVSRKRESVRAHFNQWHEFGDGQWNPLISLHGNLDGLQVYMERNEEGGPLGPGPGPNVNSPVLYDPSPGECFNVIWQFRADSRRSDEGSRGLLRIWLGDDPKPKWEWVNKATTHKLSHGGEDVVPYNKVGGYVTDFIYYGEEGLVYEARIDNYTVMANGSWSAMTGALSKPD